MTVWFTRENSLWIFPSSPFQPPRASSFVRVRVFMFCILFFFIFAFFMLHKTFRTDDLRRHPFVFGGYPFFFLLVVIKRVVAYIQCHAEEKVINGTLTRSVWVLLSMTDKNRRLLLLHSFFSSSSSSQLSEIPVEKLSEWNSKEQHSSCWDDISRGRKQQQQQQQ